MKKNYLLMAIGLLSVFGYKAQSITRLLATSPFDDILRVLDTNSYATLASKTMVFSNSNFSVSGCTGLARNPVTGLFYIIAKNGLGRHLGILNPLTGSITSQGILGDNFSHLTFNGNNTLLGCTGDGAAVPETAYRINMASAASSSINFMGAGTDGEVICYLPINNKVYHWSGNITVFYEKYDTNFVTVTNLSVGSYTKEVFGAVYKTNGKFLITNTSSQFRLVDTVGNFSPTITTYTQDLKGIAYITCPRIITGNLSVCPGSNTKLSMSTGGDAYQWFLNNVAITGAISNTYAATSIGYYKCMITDGCGTDSTANGVVVQAGNLPVVSISGNSIVCAGKTGTLTGSSGGTSQWYLNGSLIPSAVTNTLTVSAPGIYNMIKTNTNGCKDSALVGKSVLIAPLPAISIVSSASAVCAGNTVSLTASGAVSYTWSSGLNTNSLVINPTQTTTYALSGTGANGCLNNFQVTQVVSVCTAISALNLVNSDFIIYPNPTVGEFYITSQKEMSIEIINASGQIVSAITFNKKNNYTVMVNNLSKGIYFLVEQNNANASRQKLIVGE